MRARILGAVAAICLLPVASFAQDGRRSAPPPERPLMSRPSPPPGNVFRAGPGTYRPPRHLRPIYAPPIALWPGYAFFGDVYSMSSSSLLPYGNVPCAGEVHGCPVSSPYDGDPGGGQPAYGRGYVEPVPRSGPAEPPPAAVPAPPPPPVAPGVPKTFYVIPGCYAGDKPPRPEWVPPECDLSSVRVIPP